MKEKKNEGDYVPTLNSMGYMTKILDPYCEYFIDKLMNSNSYVADLGVAFGYTTRQIIKSGATVYANDIDEEHLTHLINSLSSEEKKRLFLFPGRLPEIFDFKDSFFDGVLAARCFHFLKGEEIESLVQKIYLSLKKNGKLCIVAETPYLGIFKKFIDVYEERKRNGDQWPGFVDDVQKYTNRPNTTKWVNLLDPDILERTLIKAGFKIERKGFIDRSYFPDEVRLSGKESVGIIGIK